MAKKRGNTEEKEQRTSAENTNTTETTERGATTGGTETGINPIENVQSDLVEKPKTKRPVKKKKKKTAKKEQALSPNDINPLLMGMFSLMAMKYGKQWEISEEESEAVTKPLCNILEKLNVADKVSNLSDGAGLVIGASAIVIPRIMMTDFKKDKKRIAIEKHVEGMSKNEFSEHKNREVKADSGQVNEKSEPPANSIGKELLEPVSEFVG